MLQFSKPLVVCLLCSYINLSLQQPNTTNSGNNNNNKICESLAQHSNNSLNILLIGLLSKYMVLVTNDYFVYQIYGVSLQEQINKLFLNAQPSAMNQKWPSLWHSKSFQQLRSNNFVFNAFTVYDTQSDYVCFTTKAVVTDLKGVCYDLNKDEVITGWQYHGNDNQVLISVKQNLVYYALEATQSGSNGLQMSQYTFNAGTMRGSTRIIQSSEWKPLCKQGDGDVMFQKNHYSSCPSGGINWPILKGFVDDKQIYLFGSDYVFSFDQQAFNQPGSDVSVKKISLQDFFLCKATVHPNYKGGSIPIYLIIILLILILLLCLILFCVKKMLDDDENNKKKKKKQTSANMSIRSAGSKCNDPKMLLGKPRSKSLLSNQRSTSKGSFGKLSSVAKFGVNSNVRSSDNVTSRNINQLPSCSKSRGSSMNSVRSSRSSQRKSTRRLSSLSSRSKQPKSATSALISKRSYHINNDKSLLTRNSITKHSALGSTATRRSVLKK